MLTRPLVTNPSYPRTCFDGHLPDLQRPLSQAQGAPTRHHSSHRDRHVAERVGVRLGQRDGRLARQPPIGFWIAVVVQPERGLGAAARGYRGERSVAHIPSPAPILVLFNIKHQTPFS